MNDVPLPLPVPEQRNPPPRPTTRDANVRRAAVELIMPEVQVWLGDDWPDSNPAEIADDIMSVLDHDDGYRACHALEHSRHWSPDEALVDILSMLPTRLSEAVAAAARLWVEVNGITPKSAIGDVVVTPHGEGPIVRIEQTMAWYVVATDEYRRQYPKGAGGFIIPYEQCRAAERAEAA